MKKRREERELADTMFLVRQRLQEHLEASETGVLKKNGRKELLAQVTRREKLWNMPPAPSFAFFFRSILWVSPTLGSNGKMPLQGTTDSVGINLFYPGEFRCLAPQEVHTFCLELAVGIPEGCFGFTLGKVYSGLTRTYNKFSFTEILAGRTWLLH
jgi:hypothetical protein